MKKIIFLICLLLLMPIAFAIPPQGSPVGITQQITGITVLMNEPTVFSRNSEHTFRISLFNATSIFTNETTCNLKIFFSQNSTKLYDNTNSSFEGNELLFTVPASVHNNKGIYFLMVICNTTDQTGLDEHTYYVLENGSPVAEDLFMTFIYFIFIIATIGLFSSIFVTIVKLVLLDLKVKDILISYCFFGLNLIVIFMAQEYLLSTFIENLAITFMKVTAWSNIIAPLIVYLICLAYKSHKKRSPPTPQDLGGISYGN